MSAHASRVPVEERLFSVVLALVATENGLTRDEILRSVQGYRQRFEEGGAGPSLERQFERDKEDLRDLGIPLEVLEEPGRAGDNHGLRYRIPKKRYDMPSDVVFTAEERALLALAAAVWRQGSLSAQSRRALTKLRGVGAEPVEPLIGLAPRLNAREASFEPLSRALERHLAVRFSYLKPGDAGPRARVVEPHALVQHRGRWHLYGWDRGADAVRTFLLTRITGQVTLTSDVFAPPGGDPAGQALRELDLLWERQSARLLVAEGSEAALQLSRRVSPAPAGPGGGPAGHGSVLAAHYTDLHVFADELAGYGPEVVVAAPRKLREAVIGRLRSVAAAHAKEPPAAPERLAPVRPPAAASAGHATDRVVLLLALIPYVLEHGSVTVPEAAQHFGVAAERIRRAVRLIAVSGVPGQSRRYLPGDLFDIDWDDFEDHDRIVLTHLVAIDEVPRLSAREAAALIAGLQYLQPWLAGEQRAGEASLMAKLVRSSSAEPSAVAVDAGAPDDRIGPLRAAIEQARQVEFDYHSVGGETMRRIVDPLRLDAIDDAWYLRGWCHTRQAVRTFRLERVSGLRATARPTVFRAGSLPIPERIFDGTGADFVIDVEVDDGYLPMIVAYLEADTPVVRRGEAWRTTVRAAHVHGVKRLAARLCGRLRVIEPASARRAVAEWAREGLAGYAVPAPPRPQSP
ncbi:MAG TPA: WYL domain-containing protein [Microbacteriaceae bacterium]|nr:WYL domain-containing protein [Microbacteriaceae bacterium]